jgi:hypothetical protein
LFSGARRLCYKRSMTKEQLEAIFDRVRAWPEWRQREAVELLSAIEAEAEVYSLSSDERADLDEALAEMDRGEVATQVEVEAVFRKAR